MKTARDLLQKLGVTESDLSKSCPPIGCLDLEFKDHPYYENGDNYAIRILNIRTFDAVQSVTIYRAVEWTDGSFRPTYTYTEDKVSVYLNKRLFEEGLRHGKI